MSSDSDKYYRYVARMKPEHTQQVLDEYDFTKVKMINRVSQVGASPCAIKEAMSPEINTSAVTISPS